jgi:thiol:disulfide interchange protein
LAAVVTAFSLSLFGVFAVFTPKVINKLGAKAEGEGVSSAFFTGVLATVLGTACTAPFLSAAVGAASRFSPGQGAVIFLAVGVGMALPFLILAANPTWLRFIPKPGPWMGTFEAMMGFLLLGTVVWLLNPLRGQLGDFGLLLALVFLLAVALAVWVKGGIAFADPMGRKAMLNSLAIFILLVGWMLPFRWMATIDELIAARIQQNELIALGEESQDSETGDSSVHPGRLNFTWPDEGIPGNTTGVRAFANS